MIALIHLEMDSMPYFSVSVTYVVVWILWPELQILRGEYGFSINSKISFMGSGDKPTLTLNIQVKNFWRFRYAADFFDIKIVLLGQNSFE